MLAGDLWSGDVGAGEQWSGGLPSDGPEPPAYLTVPIRTYEQSSRRGSPHHAYDHIGFIITHLENGGARTSCRPEPAAYLYRTYAYLRINHHANLQTFLYIETF